MSAKPDPDEKIVLIFNRSRIKDLGMLEGSVKGPDGIPAQVFYTRETDGGKPHTLHKGEEVAWEGLRRDFTFVGRPMPSKIGSILRSFDRHVESPGTEPLSSPKPPEFKR